MSARRACVVFGLLNARPPLLPSAEVNVVLHRRLRPRSFAGDLAPADRLALRQSADASRQDPREEILVRFIDDAGGGPPSRNHPGG